MRVAILTTDNREHQRTYEEMVPRFGPAIEAVLEGLARQADLEVHVVACTQRPMHAPEKLSENTWFHLLDVPKIGWLRTGYQGCVRAIRKKLRELGPDLVHGQGTERECALSAALSGFPNVVTIHGNMGAVAQSVHARPVSYLWCAARLETFALRRTGGVFCNSAYTEELVRPSCARTWRVPNALRGAFFNSRPATAIARTRPLLLNVGGILRYKRQNELLDLAEELQENGYDFELQLLGTPNQRDAYGRTFSRRIAELAARGRVRNLAPLALPELIDLFDQASALIHIPTEEAFGLVAAEALARNLKLFGTRVGGLVDIAAGVEGAELFACDEEGELTAEIARWLEAGAPQPTSAAAEMRARYHPDVIARRHVEIYREFLQRS